MGSERYKPDYNDARIETDDLILSRLWVNGEEIRGVEAIDIHSVDNAPTTMTITFPVAIIALENTEAEEGERGQEG
jgi:hypothetical protein